MLTGACSSPTLMALSASVGNAAGAAVAPEQAKARMRNVLKRGRIMKCKKGEGPGCGRFKVGWFNGAEIILASARIRSVREYFQAQNLAPRNPRRRGGLRHG